MESNTKFKGVRIAAGLLFIYFALEGVDYITDLFRYRYEPTLFYAISVVVAIVANTLVAVNLLKGKGGKALKVGLLIIAITEGYYLFESLCIYQVNIILGLVDVLNFAAAVMLVVVVNRICSEKDENSKATMKQLWFVPGACAAGAFLLYVIGCVVIALNFNGVVFTLMVAIAKFLLTGMYIAYPNGFEKTTAEYDFCEEGGETVVEPCRVEVEPVGYYSMAKHIILLIFTFGIWWLIWIYRTTDFLNCVKGERQRGAVAQLLLCMFVPFYIIYWTYESAKRIDKLAKAKGVESDITTMCILFTIFIGILAPIFMQDKINTIVMAKYKTTPSMEEFVIEEETVQVVETVKPVVETVPEAKTVAEDLKTYKDLLDGGIITQEEFDQKKKQILGL